jgi:vacuolar-type H+-ATPase subunit I/STV1
MNTQPDSPLDPSAGLSARRDRRWGVLGGVLGTAAGGGAFLVASLIQREPWQEMARAPYPTFFSRREIMPIDLYFFAWFLAGIGFLVAALILIRIGRYPRTDGGGATLAGAIFSALGGVILFLRLWAVLHG